jgi:signal transduction histidine kinase
MRLLGYFRFVLLTAGTLLPFFWMMVILGHRRHRSFERVLFFFCLALTLFFGSSLLALNAQLFYGSPPSGLLRFAWTFLCLGLWFVPSLAVHLHIEYGALRGLLAPRPSKDSWLLVAYLPAAILQWNLLAALRQPAGFDFERPSHALGVLFQFWFVAALTIAGYWERRFYQAAPDREQKSFHRVTFQLLALLAGLFLFLLVDERIWPAVSEASLSPLLFLIGLIPLALLTRSVQRFNFLQIGRQRNLIYAVFGVFVALLYLSFVRRASLWLEPHLPPEATAALLLFLPIVFFEPLQRVIRQHLRQTAQSEVDRAQKLLGPINEVARLGDPEKLRRFTERWIAEQLQLAEAEIELLVATSSPGYATGAKSGAEEVFLIARSAQPLARLRVRAHGAMISGETFAALEFLCEQVPAAFDLCNLIGEKLQLERELAERERMALVGQLAASISHNLKNPLGSIKTILQVQMEGAELPASLRGETQMVLDEINRLSGKLNQLLQFSRPGVRGPAKSDRCNIVAVAKSVAEVLCREAESRGVVLELAPHGPGCEVACSAEAANDVLSNVILNAIEAVSQSGHVSVALQCEPRSCTVAVEDDGPGIAPALREKIVQPFFTTKPRGTGLGLAIVARRLEEIGGQLEINSPIVNERGTRFRLEFPLAAKELA